VVLANRARDWLSEAEYDLETAVILLENRRYNAACFYAQQAAEKAVKAVLLSRNIWRVGHSVLDLLKELRHHVEVPEELLDAARALDKHYIPPRYPNVFNSGAPHEYYTEEDAREAVELAGKVLAFARRALRTH